MWGVEKGKLETKITPVIIMRHLAICDWVRFRIDPNYPTGHERTYLVRNDVQRQVIEICRPTRDYIYFQLCKTHIHYRQPPFRLDSTFSSWIGGFMVLWRLCHEGIFVITTLTVNVDVKCECHVKRLLRINDDNVHTVSFPVTLRIASWRF